MAIESFPTMTVPLRVEPNGAVRVSTPATRVPYELVVWLHQRGETPEQIQEAYPTIELADIYAVIAYYLCNREAVDAYLRETEEEWERLKAEADARHPDNAALLTRLQARREAVQQGRQAS